MEDRDRRRLRNGPHLLLRSKQINVTSPQPPRCSMLGHYVRRYQSDREHDRQGQQDGVVEVAENRNEVRYQVYGRQGIGSDPQGERLRVPRGAGVMARLGMERRSSQRASFSVSSPSTIRLPTCFTFPATPFHPLTIVIFAVKPWQRGTKLRTSLRPEISLVGPSAFSCQ